MLHHVIVPVEPPDRQIVPFYILHLETIHQLNLDPPTPPLGPCISNGAHAYSQVFCSQATSFSAKTQRGQTTSSHLALFFFSRSGSFDVDASSLFLPPLVPSYLKIIFGWGEWGAGPRGPEADTAGSTQVGAAGGRVSQVRALTLDKKGRAKKCVQEGKCEVLWGHRELEVTLYKYYNDIIQHIIAMCTYVVWVYLYLSI